MRSGFALSAGFVFVVACLLSACEEDIPISQISPTQISPTPTSTADVLIFNGNYAGSGRATSNGCPFNATATVSGTIDVNSDGEGSWTKIHVGGGLRLTFNIKLQVTSATTATFTSTTTGVVDGKPYSITDDGIVTGSVLTVTQKFTQQGFPCSTVYNLTLNKQ